MKALVLTYDRCRRVAEHMLKTYAVYWPQNRFTFRIAYQQDTDLDAYGQSVELVKTRTSEVKDIVYSLLAGLPDDEWIYWCIDDKYLIGIDQDSASYFYDWISQVNDPTICGLCFCRARTLLRPESASVTAMAYTARGDELLLRYNYRQIWLHQFLRVRALRALFDAFPESVRTPSEMDEYKLKVKIPDDRNLYVTKNNYAVFGESTIAGNLTRGCVSSMRKLSVAVPENFEIVEPDIVIGSLGTIVGE